MKDQIDSFLLKGYAHFKEPGLLNSKIFTFTNVEIDDELNNNFNSEQKYHLNLFIDYVSKNYVYSLYKNFEVVYYSIWDGVDLGSTEWHNDSVEGFDFNVLYYLDNTNEKIGGSIEFRWSEGEELIYPSSGDLVFINQNGKFYHKASRSKSQRRVASIEYKIYD